MMSYDDQVEFDTFIAEHNISLHDLYQYIVDEGYPFDINDMIYDDLIDIDDLNSKYIDEIVETQSPPHPVKTMVGEDALRWIMAFATDDEHQFVKEVDLIRSKYSNSTFVCD